MYLYIGYNVADNAPSFYVRDLTIICILRKRIVLFNYKVNVRIKVFSMLFIDYLWTRQFGCLLVQADMAALLKCQDKSSNDERRKAHRQFREAIT